jgi:hypothetical protein
MSYWAMVLQRQAILTGPEKEDCHVLDAKILPVSNCDGQAACSHAA